MSEIATLHDPFAKFLRDKGIPFIRARSDRESTIAVGHPDFTILCNGSALLIEFKTKEGALSKDQRDRIEDLARTGTKVHVIRDLSTAIELFTAWHSTLKEPPQTGGFPRKLHRIGTALFEERNGELVKISGRNPLPKTET